VDSEDETRTFMSTLVQTVQREIAAGSVRSRGLEASDMKIRFRLVITVVLLAAFLGAASPVPAQGNPGGDAIDSRFAEVDGLRLHYLTAGKGPAVILLHGYTQTSRMWRPLFPRLTDKFTVIAPDLPGIGDSDIPKDGFDMKTAAVRVHALAKSLVRT
jgi:hypothetical protein